MNISENQGKTREYTVILELEYDENGHSGSWWYSATPQDPFHLNGGYSSPTFAHQYPTKQAVIEKIKKEIAYQMTNAGVKYKLKFKVIKFEDHRIKKSKMEEFF